MDKVYNKAMKSLLPEVLKPLGFEVIEVAKELRFSALSEVYVTLAYDPLWIFLEIRPHPSGWNKFYVKWGWSAKKRFVNTPVANFRPPDNELLRQAEMTRLDLGILAWTQESPVYKAHEFVVAGNTETIESGRSQEIVGPPVDVTDPHDRMRFVLTYVADFVNQHGPQMFERIQAAHRK